MKSSINVIIIDIGINRDLNNKLCGDVDYEDDDECEEWIKTTLEKFSNL